MQPARPCLCVFAYVVQGAGQRVAAPERDPGRPAVDHKAEATWMHARLAHACS